MTATVRPAQAADIPAMQRVRLSVRENRLVSAVISADEYLQAQTITGRGWVAQVHGQIVGFAVGNVQTGNIWALFVDPGHERQGHGRRLHDVMVDWLFEQGLSRLWLSTDPHSRAARFYASAGWAFTGLLASGEAHYELTRPARPAFQFEPITRARLPLLREWLMRPHVAAWWGEAESLAELEADYLPQPPDTTTTRAFIACRGGEPIGFIQSYVVMGSGGGWWDDETDPGARGIDQLLGNAEQLGQGLGAAMIGSFVDRLFDDEWVTVIQTDPSPDNQRAIRCYRRVGFADAGEVRTPDGPALLMKLRRDRRR